MDIPSLISSLNGARQLAGLLVEERDRQKVAAIQIDLTEKLIQAQTQVAEVLAAHLAQTNAVQSLRDRVRELEANQFERDRYKLAKLGVVGDAFAYVLRDSSQLKDRADEPTHYLCQTCFDNGRKSVLKISNDYSKCSLCSDVVRIKPATRIGPRRGGPMSA
jgi:hypothetical protein